MTSYVASIPVAPDQQKSDNSLSFKSLNTGLIRIIIVSLLMILCIPPKQEWKHLLCGIVTIYYFCEILCAHEAISKILAIITTKEIPFSCRLSSYINEKIAFLGLVGMGATICLTDSTPQMFFLECLCNIYYTLGFLFFMQGIACAVANRFIRQINIVKQGRHSKFPADKRRKNLTWICDVILLIFYLFCFCVMLQCVGINLKEHIFHTKAVTSASIIILTILTYRGYHEFIDTILENTRIDEKDYRIELETFLPTISTILHVILFSTSSLLILANLEINIAPILAAFTVFSAAISLAAQDIIRSFLHGITHLIEKELRVGAKVKINDCIGTIERLSVRAIYLRCVDGSLSTIPYSIVGTIVNYSQDYLAFYGNLRISPLDSVEEFSQMLRDVVEKVKNDDAHKDIIRGDVEIIGLQPFDLEGPQLFWKITASSDVRGQVVHYEIFRRLYEEYRKRRISLPVYNTVCTPNPNNLQECT
jgi:small-conductance mechanosensitive channel